MDAGVLAMCMAAIAPVEYFMVDVNGTHLSQSQSLVVQAIQSQFPPECAQILKPEVVSCKNIADSLFSSMCYMETKQAGTFFAKLDFMNQLRVIHINWD